MTDLERKRISLKIISEKGYGCNKSVIDQVKSNRLVSSHISKLFMQRSSLNSFSIPKVKMAWFPVPPSANRTNTSTIKNVFGNQIRSIINFKGKDEIHTTTIHTTKKSYNDHT